MSATRRDQHRALQAVLSELAKTGVIPRARRALDVSSQATADALRETVIAEVPAFSNSGNPDILFGLDAHITEHIDEIRRLFGGAGAGDFAFNRTHAQIRAAQRFPLDVTLHAYRCGHKVLSHWLRDAAVAAGSKNTEKAIADVADFAMEYTNAISTIVASEYISHTRMLIETESDQRTELLTILLSGYDESDGRVARLLKRSGYLEQRQTYCVVVAQSTNAAEMELPDRAKRIANAMSAAISATPIRMLSGIRNNVVVGVLSASRRHSGWTAPQTKLAERLRSQFLGLGPAVLVGMSTDQPSTSFLARALREATIALEFASVSNRVAQFSDLPIRSLMLHASGEYVRSAAPAWVVALMGTDEKVKGTLTCTLRAIADADMNVQKAGRQLGVHPNTIYARVERIKDLTGLDARRHHDLVELLLAADCWQID